MAIILQLGSLTDRVFGWCISHRWRKLCGGLELIKLNQHKAGPVGNQCYGKCFSPTGCNSYIQIYRKASEKGISQLYIEDDISEGIETEDLISDETRYYTQSVVKEVMNDILWQNRLNRVPEITKVVNNIVDELLSNDNILVNMKDIRMIDDYTFGHCTNVCILSVITGIELGYNELRLRDLGVGALLHDIGKMRIPKHILQKPGRLTSEEYEQVKQHTIYGFEILKDCDDIRAPAANAALGHHERFNGTGYPRGLTGEDTHEYAKVIAIADVYDAMTSDRVYRMGMEPYEAGSYLTSMGDILFDSELVNTFIKNIALYPVGSSVILSTGEKGWYLKPWPSSQ